MIKIWANKQTGNPSIEVGKVTVDLGPETPEQKSLFEMVTSHPEAVVQAGHLKAPLTDEIASVFLDVIRTEIIKKRMVQRVEWKITKSE